MNACVALAKRGSRLYATRWQGQPNNLLFDWGPTNQHPRTLRSECGTWSHAVMSALGARARGGVVGRLRSVSHVVRPRQGLGFEGLGWVPLGPKRVRQGPVWSRMGPYISRTLMRDSRVIRQGPSGPVGSYRVPTGFRRNLVLARRDPTGLDGSLDCLVLVHD